MVPNHPFAFRKVFLLGSTCRLGERLYDVKDGRPQRQPLEHLNGLAVEDLGIILGSYKSKYKEWVPGRAWKFDLTLNMMARSMSCGHRSSPCRGGCGQGAGRDSYVELESAHAGSPGSSGAACRATPGAHVGPPGAIAAGCRRVLRRHWRLGRRPPARRLRRAVAVLRGDAYHEALATARRTRMSCGVAAKNHLDGFALCPLRRRAQPPPRVPPIPFSLTLSPPCSLSDWPRNDRESTPEPTDRAPDGPTSPDSARRRPSPPARRTDRPTANRAPDRVGRFPPTCEPAALVTEHHFERRRLQTIGWRAAPAGRLVSTQRRFVCFGGQSSS